MVSSNSGAANAEVANWIDGVLSGTANLVTMLATTESRQQAARVILGRYGTSSPSLKMKLDALVDSTKEGDVDRLRVIRQALDALSQGKYASAILAYNAAREKERVLVFSHREAVMAA